MLLLSNAAVLVPPCCSGSVAPCCQTRKRPSFCFDYIGWNIAAQCNRSVRTPSEYSHLQSCSILQAHQNFVVIVIFSSGSRGAEGVIPPRPCANKSWKRLRPHRFHVSRSPPYPAAGSATDFADIYSKTIFCWITALIKCLGILRVVPHNVVVLWIHFKTLLEPMAPQIIHHTLST